MRKQHPGSAPGQTLGLMPSTAVRDTNALGILFAGRSGGSVDGMRDYEAAAEPPVSIYPAATKAIGDGVSRWSSILSGKLVAAIGDTIGTWVRERRVRKKVAYYSSLPDATLVDIGLVRGQIEFTVREDERRKAASIRRR
jgi:uncharacterized protein YjiS (DUF1127 family)